MARDQVVSFRHFVTVGYHFNVLDRFSCFCAAGVAGGEAVEQRSVGVRDRRRDRPNVARTGRRRQAAVLRVIHWCQGTAAAECVSCFRTVSFIRGAQNMHIKIRPCIFTASFAFIGLQWFGRNAWITLVKQKVQDLVIEVDVNHRKCGVMLQKKRLLVLKLNKSMLWNINKHVKTYMYPQK